MLHYIKGHITDTMPGAVAIETGGVAFRVNVPDNSPAIFAQPDELVTLYTEMIVREDDISLYGFTDKASLAFFRLLLNVQGVGAKAAVAILSVLSAPALRQAIALEDVAAIQKANGVGKKTAQRVVLELKEKIEKSEELSQLAFQAPQAAPEDAARTEAVAALVALGYSRSEAQTALTGITADSVEDYIRKALRNR